MNVFAPQFTESSVPQRLALNQLPTKIGIDTASGYVLDTANYRDLVILNGGVRYDNYKINTSGYGTGTPTSTCSASSRRSSAFRTSISA